MTGTSSLAVSVVIPHFDSCADLANALASLEVSTTPAEIIVVDNSLDPENRREARELSEQHGARWLPLPGNTGFAAACNAGAAQCTSDLVMFLNQDSHLESDTLSILVTHLSERPHTAAVSPAVVTPQRLVWFNGGRYRRRSGRILLRNFGEPYEPAEPSDSLFLSGCALMVRRSVYEAVGGFDERFFLYYEDLDLSERIRAQGHTLTVVPHAVAIHDRDKIGDPMRNLSTTMLTHTLRSRRIFAQTLSGRDRWIARATLPLEFCRLLFHATRAKPRAIARSTRALLAGLVD